MTTTDTTPAATMSEERWVRVRDGLDYIGGPRPNAPAIGYITLRRWLRPGGGGYGAGGLRTFDPDGPSMAEQFGIRLLPEHWTLLDTRESTPKAGAVYAFVQRWQHKRDGGIKELETQVWKYRRVEPDDDR